MDLSSERIIRSDSSELSFSLILVNRNFFEYQIMIDLHITSLVARLCVTNNNKIKMAIVLEKLLARSSPDGVGDISDVDVIDVDVVQ